MGKIRIKNAERNQEIKEQYLALINEKTASDKAITILSSKHKIGAFYLRGLLKEQGVEIDRKKKNDRKDTAKLQKRNRLIVKMFFDDQDIDKIAKKTNLTKTRIRQILKDKKVLISDDKKISDEIFEDVKQMVSDGIGYEKIVEKYGKKILKDLKEIHEYSTFQEILAQREKDIVRMYNEKKPPKEIAKKYGVVRNYIYLILHKNGLKIRLSKKDREKRNRKIRVQSSSMTPKEISEKHGITETMVKIILNSK